MEDKELIARLQTGMYVPTEDIIAALTEKATLVADLKASDAALLATIDGGEHVGVLKALIEQAIESARQRSLHPPKG